MASADPVARPRIKLGILVPFALIVLTVIGAFVGYALIDENHRHEERRAQHLETVRQLFEHDLALYGRTMRALLPTLDDIGGLRDAFEARDRAELLTLTQPLFVDLKKYHRITHFYFHLPDRTNFLRVHKPDRYGDAIERVTARKAAEEGRLITGLELGPLGTLTLRAVHPWKGRDGRLIGFIEIGIEVEHIAQDIHRVLGLDLITVVDKAFLDRDGWTAGMRMVGREGDWDRLPDRVMVTSTLAEPPQSVLSLLQGTERPSDAKLEIHADRRLYQIGALPLTEVGGRRVGALVFLDDVTALYAAGEKALWIVAFFSLAAGITVFAVFFVVLDRVEKRLRTLHDGLEGLVEERTAELRRTNADLERFAQIAAHDLQEPARSVITYTQMLEKFHGAEFPDDAKQKLGFVLDGARRMSRLVGDLLQYASIGAVNRPVTAVDTGRVVSQVLSDLESTLAAPDTIRVDLGPLPVVHGDGSQLSDLFRHLLANAFNFRAADRPLEISVSAQRTEGGWTFSVADNGIGIEPESVHHVFQVFRRLDAPSGTSGTGIGLALCKRITERHGGRIWAVERSAPGTEIRFTIPDAQPSTSRRPPRK